MAETYPHRTDPASPGGRPESLGLLLAGGGVELALLAALGWWDGAALPLPGLGLFAGAFACWVGAAAAAGEGDGDRMTLLAVWGVAVALRLVFLPLEPVLSDDVYRYLWDGWVQLQGVNPYLHAPADPVLEPLRTSWHGLINHPDVPTIYPPVAQYAFLLVATLGATVPVAKLLWLAADLATGWLLYRVARETGRNPLRTLVLYLWCPLLVVETFWSGHLEVLGLVWIAVFLVLAHRKKAGWSGAALGMAALAKFAPAAALPALGRRLGAGMVLAFGLVVAVGYLPFLDAGPALFTGLATYAEHWRFNEGAFAVLEWALGPGRPPRWAAAGILAGVIAWATYRRYDPERSLFWILGAGVLLSPTVHPWYVLWLLPFAALRTSRAWILLCGLVFLGYWGLGAYQETGTWPEPLWVRLAVWVPFWLVLLFDAWRGSTREPPQPEGQVA